METMYIIDVGTPKNALLLGHLSQVTTITHCSGHYVSVGIRFADLQ